MTQVICTSPHAKLQRLLGGVAFFPSPAGLISEHISEEKAEEFCSQPHFVRHYGDAIDAPSRPALNAGTQKPAPIAPGGTPAVKVDDEPKF